MAIFKLYKNTLDNKLAGSSLRGIVAEDGYLLSFLGEYLAEKAGIPFMEGCKSNKDRGSTKRLCDEILMHMTQKIFERGDLTDSYTFQNLKEDVLNPIASDADDIRQLIANSDSSDSTFFNTSIAGNKNIAGMGHLFENLGMKSFLKGNHTAVKSVSSSSGVIPDQAKNRLFFYSRFPFFYARTSFQAGRSLDFISKMLKL
jgi:hypothetical protein